MKKIHKILLPTLFAAALGLGAFTVTYNTKKEVKEADASYTNAVLGLYKRVRSASELSTSDTVVISSIYSDAYQNLGGNPAYLYTTTDKFHLSEDGEYAHAYNAYVNELTVHAGYGEDENNPTKFAFNGPISVWGHNYTEAYLGWDDRGSNNEHPGRPPYESVGYFKDATGVKNTIDQYSTWELEEFVTKGLDFFDKEYDLDPEDCYIKLKNVGAGGYLGFTSRYDRRLVLGGDTGINIYRRIDIIKDSTATDVHQPTKTTYNHGDELDLRGLSFVVHTDNDGDLLVTYEEFRDFFEYNKYVYGTGDTVNMVSFAGLIDINVSLHVNPGTGNYMKLRSEMTDYSGAYRVAVPNGGYSIADFKADANSRIQGQVTDDCIHVTDTSNHTNHGDITLLKSGDIYYIQNCDGEYIGWGPKYEGAPHDEFIACENTTNAVQLDIVYEDNELHIKKHNSNEYIVYTSDYFEFNTSGTKAALYRKLSDAEHDSISNFIRSFSNLVNQCHPEGALLNITTSDWSSQASTFSGLSTIVKDMFTLATYTHNAEEYDSIPDLVDRYDYIISKYDQFSDFMGRISAGTYENHYSSPSNYIPTAEAQTYSVLIITVISISSLAVMAIFFLIKKKTNKE